MIILACNIKNFKCYIKRKAFQALIFLLCFLQALPPRAIAGKDEDTLVEAPSERERKALSSALYIASQSCKRENAFQEGVEHSTAVHIMPRIQEGALEISIISDAGTSTVLFERGFLFSSHYKVKELFQEDLSVGISGILEGIGSFKCLWDGSLSLTGSRKKRQSFSLMIETPGAFLTENVSYSYLNVVAHQIFFQRKTRIEKGVLTATASDLKDACIHVNVSVRVPINSLDIIRGTFINEGNVVGMAFSSSLSVQDGYNLGRISKVTVAVSQNNTFVNLAQMNDIRLAGQGSFINHNSIKFKPLPLLVPSSTSSTEEPNPSINVYRFINQTRKEVASQATIESAFLTVGTDTHVFLNDEDALFIIKGILLQGTSGSQSPEEVFVNKGIMHVKSSFYLIHRIFRNTGKISSGRLFLRSAQLINAKGAVFYQENRAGISVDADASSDVFNEGILYTWGKIIPRHANVPLSRGETSSARAVAQENAYRLSSLPSRVSSLNKAEGLFRPSFFSEASDTSNEAIQLEGHTFESLVMHNVGSWHHTGDISYASEGISPLYLKGKIHFREGTYHSSRTLMIPKGSEVYLENYNWEDSTIDNAIEKAETKAREQEDTTVKEKSGSTVSYELAGMFSRTMDQNLKRIRQAGQAERALHHKIENHGTLILEGMRSRYRDILNLHNLGLIFFRQGKYRFRSFINTGHVKRVPNLYFVRNGLELIIESEEEFRTEEQRSHATYKAFPPPSVCPKLTDDLSQALFSLDKQYFSNTGIVSVEDPLELTHADALEIIPGQPFPNLSLGPEGLKIRTHGDVILSRIFSQGPIDIETDGDIFFTERISLQGPLIIRKAKNLIFQKDITIQGILGAFQIQEDVTFKGKAVIQKRILLECDGDWNIQAPISTSEGVIAQVLGITRHDAPINTETGVTLTTYKYEKRGEFQGSKAIKIEVLDSAILKAAFEEVSLEAQGPIVVQRSNAPVTHTEIGDIDFINRGSLKAKEFVFFVGGFLNEGHIQGVVGVVPLSQELSSFTPFTLLNRGVFEVKRFFLPLMDSFLNEGIVDIKEFSFKSGNLITRKIPGKTFTYTDRKQTPRTYDSGTFLVRKKTEITSFYEFAPGYVPTYTTPQFMRPEVLRKYKFFVIDVEGGFFHSPTLLLQDDGVRLNEEWSSKLSDPYPSTLTFAPSGESLDLMRGGLRMQGGMFQVDNLSLQLRTILLKPWSYDGSLPTFKITQTSRLNIWERFLNKGIIEYVGTDPLVLNFFPTIGGYTSLQGFFEHDGQVIAPNADVVILGQARGSGSFAVKHFFYVPYIQKEGRLYGAGIHHPEEGILYTHLLEELDVDQHISAVTQESLQRIESHRQRLEQERTSWEAQYRATEVSNRQKAEAHISALNANIAENVRRRDMSLGWSQVGGRDSSYSQQGPGAYHNHCRPYEVYHTPEQKVSFNQEIARNQASIAEEQHYIGTILPARTQQLVTELAQGIAQDLQWHIRTINTQTEEVIRVIMGNRATAIDNFLSALGHSTKFPFMVATDTCQFGVCALDMTGLILARIHADLSHVIHLRTGDIVSSSNGTDFLKAISHIVSQGAPQAFSQTLVPIQPSSASSLSLPNFLQQSGLELRPGDIMAPIIHVGGARALIGARLGMRDITQELYMNVQVAAVMASGSVSSEQAHITSQALVTAGSINIGKVDSSVKMMVDLGGHTKVDSVHFEEVPHILRVRGTLEIARETALVARNVLTITQEGQIEGTRHLSLQGPVIENAGFVHVDPTREESLPPNTSSSHETFSSLGHPSIPSALEIHTDSAFLQSGGSLRASQIGISTSGTAAFIGGTLLSETLAAIRSSALYQFPAHALQTQTAIFEASEGLALRGHTTAAQGIHIETRRMDLRDLNSSFLSTPHVTLAVAESVNVQMPTVVSPNLSLHTQGEFIVTQPLLFQGNTRVEVDGSFYNDTFLMGQRVLDIRFREGINIRHFERQENLVHPQAYTGVIQAPILYVESTQGDFINQAGDLIGHAFLGVKTVGNLYHQAGAYQTRGEHDHITRYLPGRFVSGGAMAVDVGGRTYNTASHFLAQDDLYFNSQRGYVGDTLSSTYISDRGSKSSGFMGMNKKSWITYRTDVYTPIMRSAEGFLDITIPEGLFENRGGSLWGGHGLSLFARDAITLGATVSETRTHMRGSEYFGLSKSSGGAMAQQATPTYLYGGTEGIIVASQSASIMGQGLLYDTQGKATFTAGKNIELKEVKLYNAAWSKSSGIFFSSSVTDALRAFNKRAPPLASVGTLDPLFGNIEALTHAQNPMQRITSASKSVLSAIDFSAALAKSFNTSSFDPLLSRYADVSVGYHSHKRSDIWTTSLPSQGISQDLEMQAGNTIILSGGTQLDVTRNAGWHAPLFQVVAGQDTWRHQEDATSTKLSYNLITQAVSVSSTSSDYHSSSIMVRPSVIRVGGLSTFDVDRMELLGSMYQTGTTTGRIGTLFAQGLQSTTEGMSHSTHASGVLGHFNPGDLFGSSSRINSGTYHQTYQRTQSTSRSVFEVTDQTPHASDLSPLIIESADLQASTLDIGSTDQVLLWDVRKFDGSRDKNVKQTRGIELSRASNYGFISLHTHDALQETAQRSVLLGTGFGSSDVPSDATVLIRDEDSGFDLPVFIPDMQMLSEQVGEIAQTFQPSSRSYSIWQEMEEYERQWKIQEEEEQHQRLEKIKANTFTAEDLPFSIKDGLTTEERDYFAVIYGNHIQAGKHPREVQALLEKGLVRAVLKETSKVWKALQDLRSASPSLREDPQENATAGASGSIPIITLRPKLESVHKILRLAENAGLALAEIDTHHPWLTPITLSTFQMALLGPARYIASEATHAVVGNAIEDLKRNLYTYVAEKLEVSEGLVEVTASCVGIVANIFLGNSKSIVQDAKTLAKAVKKREASIDSAVEAFDKASAAAVRGERVTFTVPTKRLHNVQLPHVREARSIGMKEHEKLSIELAQKQAKNPGWKSGKRLNYKEGGYGIPDGMTPPGRPIELKPNTASGIQKGIRQLKKYEKASGERGILILYDKTTGARTYVRTPYQPT